MAASGVEKQVSLKLMVSKEKNVLFAEAGKDFVDILISFLTLPLGTIARLVAKESEMHPVKVGSLSSLYQSVSKLDPECLCNDTCKEMLSQPRNPMEEYCRSMKLNIDDTQPTKYYVCDNLLKCRYGNTVKCSTFKNKKCSCGGMLAKPISLKSCDVFDGFVKNNSSFIITDDLVVIRKSLDKMFSMIKKLGIEDMSSLTEMTVNVTKDQIIDLLKCSLLSKTTLTDVFLRKNLYLKKFEMAKISPIDFAAEECTRINVSLMYEKYSGKIVCAQGNEDFANLLLSFLTFPLGAVVRLLEGNSSMGSVDGLYRSIVGLNEDFFKSEEVKDKLVYLGLAPQFKLSNQILSICELESPKYFCYTRGFESRVLFPLADYYLTSKIEDIFNWKYKTCTSVDMVDPISEDGRSKRFVNGPTLYVATDGLVIAPMSSIFVMSFVNNMNTHLSDVEEKVVGIGVNEALSILKAFLVSSSALTTGLRHLIINV